jgi:hypothetical protein
MHSHTVIWWLNIAPSTRVLPTGNRNWLLIGLLCKVILRTQRLGLLSGLIL